VDKFDRPGAPTKLNARARANVIFLIFLKSIVLLYQDARPQTDFKSPFTKLISGLLLLNGTASIKPAGRKSWAGLKSLTLQDICLCQAFTIKAPAELFAYRVVLNGIVLARSTQEIVFTDYMTCSAKSDGALRFLAG
jgi:hypothetical protein